MSEVLDLPKEWIQSSMLQKIKQSESKNQTEQVLTESEMKMKGITRGMRRKIVLIKISSEIENAA